MQMAGCVTNAQYSVASGLGRDRRHVFSPPRNRLRVAVHANVLARSPFFLAHRQTEKVHGTLSKAVTQTGSRTSLHRVPVLFTRLLLRFRTLSLYSHTVSGQETFSTHELRSLNTSVYKQFPSFLSLSLPFSDILSPLFIKAYRTFKNKGRRRKNLGIEPRTTVY